MNWNNRLPIYTMKNFWGYTWEHSGCLLKEKGSEWLHSTIDIIPSHLQLFTPADLSSPSHRVPLFTLHVRDPVLNIRTRKYFDGEKFAGQNNILVTNFRTMSTVRKYFHREKRLITVYMRSVAGL